jgi:hypothetical protein
VSIWFYLWLLLSGGLLFFMGWTMLILFRQKKAWKQFAARHKLRYKADAMMAPPEVSGVLNDYTVSLFTGEHMTPEQRSSRKLTAIEVSLTSRLPFDLVVATGGMVDLARGLNLKEEIRPESVKWEKGWFAGASSRAAADAYLTPERLSALTGLMRKENTWVVFICRNDAMLLRLDTPHPLDTQIILDTLTKEMIAAARVLELKNHEDKVLSAEAARKTSHKKTVSIDDADLSAVVLKLEDDALSESTDSEPKN